MLKSFTLLGLIIALALIAIFAADAFAKWPFHGYSTTMDYGFIVAGVILAYMSVATFRELP